MDLLTEQADINLANMSDSDKEKYTEMFDNLWEFLEKYVPSIDRDDIVWDLGNIEEHFKEVAYDNGNAESND